MGFKLFYEALGQIPQNFIDEETRCYSTNDSIVIVNPQYKPMIYRKPENKWEELKAIETKQPPIHIKLGPVAAN
jgi:hypothetical protein